MSAITCTNLGRNFKNVKAVDNVSLDIAENQIFGLLGPNGSGKTTLLNLFQGLDVPTSGTVSVLGFNPRKDRVKLMPLIGTQLQEAATIPRLSVRETLDTYASFYHISTNRIDRTIAAVGLEERANHRIEKLSGGQRQRAFIALAILHNPRLMFFDELTSALDPKSRLRIWSILRELKEAGHSIILTTHSMEEAFALCDRIAIMDSGRIIAEDTPQGLIDAHTAGSILTLNVSQTPNLELLARLPEVEKIQCTDRVLTAIGSGNFAPTIIAAVAQEGVSITHMKLSEATLEDVFLQLTGRQLNPKE